MPCLKCKKKGIPMICKYCNLGFCSRCILLEMHNCSGANLKKQDNLDKLKTQLEFKKTPKVEII